jgi:hypothetical protein
VVYSTHKAWLIAARRTRKITISCEVFARSNSLQRAAGTYPTWGLQRTPWPEFKEEKKRWRKDELRGDIHAIWWALTLSENPFSSSPLPIKKPRRCVYISIDTTFKPGLDVVKFWSRR